MGRDGDYWSVEECRWLPCPEAVAPQQATSPEEAVVAEAPTA
jgi:hypothetical protein